MARIAGKGGAARVQRAALPSSQELLNKISGSSIATGMPTSASVGEFGDYDIISTFQFYKPQSAREVTRRNQAGQALAPSTDSDYYYIDNDGNYVDRSSYRQSYDEDIDTGELVVPGYKGPQQDEATAAAPLTLVPTSSTDPDRPRTVAAGYDKTRNVITVVFRDGTFYNYYEVSSAEWQDFKKRVSKGQYIYRYLDFKPRGPANVSSVPAGVRKAFYGYARLSQASSGGKQYNTQKRK
jgi:hypothetical protein